MPRGPPLLPNGRRKAKPLSGQGESTFPAITIAWSSAGSGLTDATSTGTTYEF